MTGDKRWAFTFFRAFSANYHFCYLPGCAFEPAENTSIDFFALRILRSLDFWLRRDMRFMAPIDGGGEHTASVGIFAECVFFRRRGGVGLVWRGLDCGICRFGCD